MQKTPFQNFFTPNDFGKAFEQYQPPYQSMPFDMSALLETQRKNFQAMSDAQKTAFENMQTIAQRQGEILSQLVEENGRLAQELMTEGTPEEKMAKNADVFKSVYEKSIRNLDELSELVRKSNDETSGIINKRISASVSEFKSALEKSGTQKKAA